jgi:LacI family transcriptional regulator
MKLQELADLAGVSPATVSRVFSHHPNVKREVRDSVLALARKHRYHPRLPARQRNVVIILPRNEIYPIRNCLEMVMMALTAVLPGRGFRIEVLPDDSLDRLESLQFCGAVAIGADPAAFKDWGVRFPPSLVLIDREAAPGSRNVFSVHSDEKQGMDLAIGCLHERGCEKIGCVIHGAPGTGNADVRRAGVLEALARRGLPAADSLVHLCGEDAEYLEVIGRLLKLGVDGLFCPGGSAGIIAAYALSLFNKRVPDDVSLVASENKLYSRYATPPQTTITQDHIRLAEIAADIIEAFPDASRVPSRTVLPYSLIVRDSVRTSA